MKYWSFWYFWSIFVLIFASMCNINIQIPVYQNQRSHAEQDYSLLHSLGSSSTSSWASGPGYNSGMGSSLWTHTASWAVTHLCPHPFARPPCSEDVRGSFLCLQSACSLETAWRKSISVSCSLEENHFYDLQSGITIWTARNGRNGDYSASEKVWPQHVSSRF